MRITLTSFLSSILFFCVFQTHVYALESNHLVYTLKPMADRISVTLSLKGDPAGKTTLSLPNQPVENLVVKSKHQSLVFDETTDLKTITHVPGELLHIQYDVKQSFQGRPKTQQQARTPIFRDDFIHFIGESVFMVPKRDATAHQNWNITLHWEVPSHWKIANSYGANQAKQNLQGRFPLLKAGLYLAGDIKLLKKMVNDQAVWIAFSKDFDYFSEEKLTTILAKLIDAQRDFWDDNQVSFYLISILGFEATTDEFGGRALRNSFVMFLPDYFKTQQIDPIYEIAWLISHEHFHRWNIPLLFQLPDPEKEEQYYWFTEGLTDYYAGLFLLRTGIGDFKHYVKAYNRLLEQYYTSPVRDLPNSEINTDVWKNRAIEKLPYQRGNLLAHNWNAQIRLNTNYEKSLDNFIKALIHPGEHIFSKENKLDLDDLIEISKDYIAGGITEDLQRYIEKGVLIVPDENALGPCCTRFDRAITKPDFETIEIPQFRLDEEQYQNNPDTCLNWFK